MHNRMPGFFCLTKERRMKTHPHNNKETQPPAERDDRSTGALKRLLDMVAEQVAQTACGRTSHWVEPFQRT